MKIYLYSILALVMLGLSACSNSNTTTTANSPTGKTPPNDWKKDNLKGRVKWVKYPALEQYYNEQGYLTRVVMLDNPVLQQQLAECDTQGRPTRLRLLTPDSTLLSSVEIKYNAQGFPTEQRSYEQPNTPAGGRKYIYDKDLNVVEEVLFNERGDSAASIQFRYDANGNKIEQKNGTTIYTYTYDAQGYLLTVARAEAGKPMGKGTYTYDANGHQLSAIEYTEGKFDTASKNVKYQYVLDKQNNWIERTDDKGQTIKRQIAYWE